MPITTLQKLNEARSEYSKAKERRDAIPESSPDEWMPSALEVSGMAFCFALSFSPAIVICLPAFIAFLVAYMRDQGVRERHQTDIKIATWEMSRLQGEVHKRELESASDPH
jgi:uncharacterized membrane protein YjjP (DUF1212 family)